jgi:nucleotide-binding universal stress UspA family protein
MKHILVATDFSDTAAAALAQGVKLSTLSGARLTLLHVIFADRINETLLGLDAMEHLTQALDNAGPPGGTAIDRLRDAAQSKLDEAIAALPTAHPKIETAIADGRPSVEIAKFADERDVDLIVLGTHGRSRLGKAFIGSVADHLIRQSDIPVMVVRK